MTRVLVPTLLTLLTACSPRVAAETSEGTVAAAPVEAGQAEAVFAGGCFWCIEKPFDEVEGVVSTTSGYTGGPELNPTYEDVGYHRTGHIEALRVVYDPSEVSYAELLQVFWHNIDPGNAGGQFCDRGEQYRTAVFTSEPSEIAEVERTRDQVAEQLGVTVDTRILPAQVFWVAEDYHQDFYLKNPTHYSRYRTGCGRDARLQELWGEQAGH
jgi:peptide-methionine (S)-S-oxide reductase